MLRARNVKAKAKAAKAKDMVVKAKDKVAKATAWSGAKARITISKALAIISEGKVALSGISMAFGPLLEVAKATVVTKGKRRRLLGDPLVITYRNRVLITAVSGSRRANRHMLRRTLGNVSGLF